MRCPKCQYISFDSGHRCRNCGYEFSLTADTGAVDLPIQTGNEPLGPLGDFALEVDRGRSANAGVPVPDRVRPPAPVTSSFDLPLFKERRTGDDAPLVAPTASPRAPLSVRRSSPTPPRVPGRGAVDEPVLDLGVADPFVQPAARPAVAAAPPLDAGMLSTAAPLGSRLLAALLDATILLTIGFIVLYLTLKICGLPVARVATIPPIPFAAFLLLIDGGYFTLFVAAGGQTIGKMAAGIRVVSIGLDHTRVPLSHSVLRAAAYLASALPAGLGFLPALVGADKRALHDRLADTRVVKA